MKIFAFLTFVLIFSLSVSAQTPKEIHTKIQKAVEEKDFRTAFLELENLRRGDEKVFQANNYDYLLARIAEKQGDLATAMANYQTVADRNSILSEYALWHLSQIARSTGNLFLEKIYLRELLTIAPSSLTNDAANRRMARSFFESKDFASAIRLLNELQNNDIEPRTNTDEHGLGNDNPNSKFQIPKLNEQTPIFRENSVLLGQAYLQNNQITQAREIFTKLITNLPNPSQPDDFALAAVKALDELDAGKENFGKIAAPLTDTEHFRRASIYQFNRNFLLARLHFQAIAEKYPNSPFAADALYQIGRGFTQERNFTQAINWFERVQAQFPSQEIARDALSQAASAYSRVNKSKEAISRYQRFIEKYPNADNLERAYLNIVDVLRDSGEESDALKWTAKTQEVFRGKLPEAIALFAQARIRIAQSDWQNALFDLEKLLGFSDLGGTRIPGGTNRAEIAFLRGFALENLRRYAEAIDVYLTIPDGRTEYYGWRATERLKFLSNSEKTKPFAEKKMAELGANIEIRNAEAQRKAALSILRLNNSPEIHRKMLEILKKAYSVLPDYQKIPSGKLLELGRKEVLKQKSTSLRANYHQTLADELLFLGLYDEAAPELEIAFTEGGKLKTENAANDSQNPKYRIQNPKSNDFDYTLAVFYRRGDMANRAISYVEPLWRSVPADYELELIPPDQIELLYPAPYADALLKYAPERAVDPRFILAIMRQESGFRADVKSNAAARGLMQFISTTSNQFASKLGKENFNQDELYNPPTAILFGAEYLSNLFRQFPNQPQAVAASYNGGEDNMTRWLTRAKSNNPDLYVPEIAYTQSKDYVYKVMANYRVYQMFYDEKLRAK